MPYVLPGLDSVPRSLRGRISPTERAANSSKRERAQYKFSRDRVWAESISLPRSDHACCPGLAVYPAAARFAVDPLALPCAQPRARRVRREQEAVPFPSSDVLADASNATVSNYVLAPVEPTPKHLPINSGKNGALRLSMDAIKAAITGAQQQQQQEPVGRATATTPTPSLRKKSGELVKPSLKHAHTLSGGLPTQKSLRRHQLEHVRLFLAEQKPTAVSRDGSPTETSEGEGNEFPWYGRGNAGAGAGYGSSDDERARKALRVKNTNVPANASIEGADIRVQSLTLSEDGSSLVGVSSEVSARYIDTVGDGIDRFGFTIKLGDVLHRIEEKTLFVAVRYTVSGREIWDSNNGQNYMVSFTKERESAVTTTTNGWNSAGRPSRGRATKCRICASRSSSRPRPSVRGMSFSGFEAKKPTVASIVAEVKPAPPKLGSRYDFGAAPRQRPCADAFRMPELKQGSDAAAPKRNVRTHEKRRVPRDAEDGMLRCGWHLSSPLSDRVASISRLPPSLSLLPLAVTTSAAYFDAWPSCSGVKRTCSGAPADGPTKDMIPASWMDGTDLFVNRDVLGGSVASTPSVTSASSPSQSPSSPPEFLPSPDIVEADLGKPLSMPMPGQVDPTNYSSFLDRFCFFTGGDDLAGYSEATARTLRAVSSTLSNNSSEGSTPRAGSPASLRRSPSPVQVN
ncbi:Starch/carbohydrate-binding module (family 53) [Rhizoctonia solani]|uniref:Starch/carbohydrate-binding module (Family 53) n=1 Tax=Rhizoctonia solani TaxID=456999 RepID=A0A8H7M363_9AGAM|nr:Starch/carbohydrate-binding module (family 53) [Rhizoctonia solani]